MRVLAGERRSMQFLPHGPQFRHEGILQRGVRHVNILHGDPRLGQRVEVAAVPLLHRAELGGPGHERDLAVPERRQVAGGLVPARVVVHDHGVHRRQPGDRLVHHDHREPAGDCPREPLVGPERAEVHHAVDGPGRQQLDVAGRPHGLAAVRAQQDHAPVPFHRLDRVVGDGAEVRVADLGDHEADHAGPAPGQVPGLRVRDVTELADGLEHLGFGGRGHPELPVQVPRHGGRGDPRCPGDVLDRGHVRSSSFATNRLRKL